MAATYSSSLHSYSTVNAPYNVGFATYTATASGSGSSSENVVDVYGGVRSATGGGGATAGDFANGLRTSVKTALGSGQGGVTGVVSAVAHLRLATATGSGDSSATGLRTAVATGSSTGSGTQSGTGLRTTFQIAVGAAVGGSTVTDRYAAGRDATGSGGATTGDFAVGVRITFGTAFSSGLGSSTAAYLRIVLRTASDSVVGISVSDELYTAFRSATSVLGVGYTAKALWKFPSAPLSKDVVMPPKRLFNARPYAIRR